MYVIFIGVYSNKSLTKIFETTLKTWLSNVKDILVFWTLMNQLDKGRKFS